MQASVTKCDKGPRALRIPPVKVVLTIKVLSDKTNVQRKYVSRHLLVVEWRHLANNI